MSSVKDVFLEFLMIFKTAMSKNNCIFMLWVCSKEQIGYGLGNKECFKFSNT